MKQPNPKKALTQVNPKGYLTAYFSGAKGGRSEAIELAVRWLKENRK